MTSIVIVFPKIEDAKGIKNILIRNGHAVSAVCSTGAQAISQADGLNDGIVICGYKLPDMMFRQLKEYLPAGFEMLLVASRNFLEESAGSDVMSLTMPLKIHDLVNTVDLMIQNVERRRRRMKTRPRERKPEEVALIKKAKALLMDRNHMTEEEAHRYIQKCSMDSGTNMVETAEMVLSVMRI